MASGMCIPRCMGASGTIIPPDSSVRGRHRSSRFCSLSRQLLTTDPVDTYGFTLTNVVVGSFWQIEELVAGTVIASGTAGSSTVFNTLDVYSLGSAKNDLRVKVRKASGSPYYQPYETQLTITAGGSSSIFVNQVRDDV